jgi:hypothetical protein
MTIASNILALSFIAVSLSAQKPETFEYRVHRMRLGRPEPGSIQIDESGIRYAADNGKTGFTIPFRDLLEVNVADPKSIQIEQYDVLKRKLGGRRSYRFRLEGTHDDRLAAFLASKLSHPLIGAYPISEQKAFEIPAYHRRALGGSHGSLRIGSDGIRYVTPDEKDSRTWLYRDIETIGATDQFHLRVTTTFETFTFDLKDRLPEDAYQLAWTHIYDVTPKHP